jgi:hypothetical protein
MVKKRRVEMLIRNVRWGAVKIRSSVVGLR